jgi:mRNA-degrading endonuclease RelE of RelBE toxin-antitoxin system
MTTFQETSTFKREYKKIRSRWGEKERKAFDTVLSEIAEHPKDHRKFKMLRGSLEGEQRARFGDYRLRFVYDSSLDVVTLISVAHRKEVYND